MKNFALIFVLLFTSLAYAATSQENRANLKYEITAQYGINYGVGKITQGSIGYYLNPNDQIAFKAGRGQEGDDKLTNFTLQYKHFTGNSFYVAPEVHYLNYFEDDDTPSLLDYEKEKFTGIGAGIRIGNQWQWKYLTLGFDWIGINHVLAHWSKKEDVFDSPWSFTIGNCYIGLAF